MLVVILLKTIFLLAVITVMRHISLNIFEANSLTVILFRIIRGEGGNLEARWSRKAQAQQVQNFIYLYESDTVI